MDTGTGVHGLIIGQTDEAVYIYDPMTMKRPMWRGLATGSAQQWQSSYVYPHAIPENIRVTVEKLRSRELQWILEYCLSQP